jgi:hypothetical protein
MAQAELELPDPVEITSDAGAKPAVEDSDDLLAQMAGQEIDRLLAESEGDAAPKAAVEFSAEIPEPEPPAAPAAAPPVPAQTSAEPTNPEPTSTAQTSTEPTSPAPAGVARTEVARAGPAGKKSAAEDLAAEDLNAVLATATAERDALRDIPKTNSPLGPLAAAVEGNLKNQSPEIDLPPEPWWGLLLRPLIWINSPLDAWPDAVRDAIGKVAVITLLNSVAVIAYVLIFRRHHH